MNLLILGMGGVGSVIAKTLAKNNKFDTVICADVNEEQVNKVVQAIGRDNFRARVVNAADFESVREAARDVDLVINAVIPGRASRELRSSSGQNRYNLQVTFCSGEGCPILLLSPYL